MGVWEVVLVASHTPFALAQHSTRLGLFIIDLLRWGFSYLLPIALAQNFLLKRKKKFKPFFFFERKCWELVFPVLEHCFWMKPRDWIIKI